MTKIENYLLIMHYNSQLFFIFAENKLLKK